MFSAIAHLNSWFLSIWNRICTLNFAGYGLNWTGIYTLSSNGFQAFELKAELHYQLFRVSSLQSAYVGTSGPSYSWELFPQYISSYMSMYILLIMLLWIILTAPHRQLFCPINFQAPLFLHVGNRISCPLRLELVSSQKLLNTQDK